MTAEEKYDVIIIGSGPAGATCGIKLREQGLSVLCIEKDDYPRFHIGESLTGNAGKLIRELGLEAAMAASDFPEKPGVNVIGTQSKNEFFVPILFPTWQVTRSKFDSLLKDKAIESGVVYKKAVVKQVILSAKRVVGVSCLEDRKQIHIRSKVVVDASGQSTFLSRKGLAGKRQVEFFSKQVASFSHFENVKRDRAPFATATTLLYAEKYHWAWIIPISSTVDSLGIVMPKDKYSADYGSPENAISLGMEYMGPELTRRFEDAVQIEKPRSMVDFSYKIEPFVGDGWLCIGDSHRFLDPIFSYGVSFAMREAIQASQAITQCLSTNSWQEPFYRFRDWSDKGQAVASDLIRYFWLFPVFFGYQMRNPKFREEIIRLLGGDCFETENFETAKTFRRAVRDFDLKFNAA